MGIGDWGLGIGGLGVGPNTQALTPKPHLPDPSEKIPQNKKIKYK